MTADDIKCIHELRAAGYTWTGIARTMRANVSADVLRKRFGRAVSAGDTDVGVTLHVPQSSFSYPEPVKILVIPDTQVTRETPLEHFRWAGRYAAEKQPDVIVHMGDFLDMHSLSTYNNARQREGLRLAHDVEAGEEALDLFRTGLDGYKPKLQFITLGNHEDRLNRYIGDHPELEGSLSLPDFAAYGWQAYPFKQAVSVNDVYFAHYFTRSARGWTGKNAHPTAEVMVRREMVSCVAGHTPGLSTYVHPTIRGRLRGLIAGSFYLHDEDWIGPHGNEYWRGMVMLHSVRNGWFDQMEIQMNYLRNKYA